MCGSYNKKKNSALNELKSLFSSTAIQNAHLHLVFKQEC